MKIREMSISEYISSLASGEPAPGGGAASALSVTQGLALGLMTTELTIGKSRYAKFEDVCRNVNSLFREYIKRTEELIDEDSDAFKEVMDAYKSKDKEAIEKAYIHAATVPFETVSYALKGMQGLEMIKDRYNPNCLSDYMSAAYALVSGGEGALKNVEINMGYISDREILDGLEKAATLMDEARRILEEISGTDN